MALEQYPSCCSSRTTFYAIRTPQSTSLHASLLFFCFLSPTLFISSRSSDFRDTNFYQCKFAPRSELISIWTWNKMFWLLAVWPCSNHHFHFFLLFVCGWNDFSQTKSPPMFQCRAFRCGLTFFQNRPSPNCRLTRTKMTSSSCGGDGSQLISCFCTPMWRVSCRCRRISFRKQEKMITCYSEPINSLNTFK